MQIDPKTREHEPQPAESLAESGPPGPGPADPQAVRPGRWIHPLIRIHRVADPAPAPEPYA